MLSNNNALINIPSDDVKIKKQTNNKITAGKMFLPAYIEHRAAVNFHKGSKWQQLYYSSICLVGFKSHWRKPEENGTNMLRTCETLYRQ